MPSAEEDDSTYMAVIMGVLIAVILLLAAVIFVIVSRHRKRKCFASPLNSKSALPTSHAALNASEKGVGSSAGTLGGAYGVREVGAGLVDGYGHVHGAPPANGPSLGGDMDHLLEGKLDDYQEPYQALKYAPYYSYSTVVMELGDQLSKSATTPSGEENNGEHKMQLTFPRGPCRLLVFPCSHGNLDSENLFSSARTHCRTGTALVYALPE